MREGEWLEKSAVIASEVLGIGRVLEAEHVLVYLSIPENREVFTGNLIGRLADAGKKLAVPVIRNGRLDPCRYLPGDQLVKGRFGQPEPQLFRSVEPNRIEVLIMPVVAVDARGSRLGYGRGYFDRFLSALAAAGRFPCRIGLAFSLQIVPAVPGDPWDEPLDYAVHEGGIMKFI